MLTYGIYTKYFNCGKNGWSRVEGRKVTGVNFWCLGFNVVSMKNILGK